MCHTLGSKGGRQKEKDRIQYIAVGNFVLYCNYCGFSHALLVSFTYLLVFITYISSFTCKL